MLDDGLTIGSAGLLRERKQAWVSVEVPDNITTPEGVEFRPNLLACSSHDASLKTRYKRVVTNVVCDNTMATGLHTVADDFAAEVTKLCQTTVTDRAWKAFLDAHTPIPDEPGRARTNAANRRSALTRLWTSDSRVSPWKNTGWGVVQARQHPHPPRSRHPRRHPSRTEHEPRDDDPHHRGKSVKAGRRDTGPRRDRGAAPERRQRRGHARSGQARVRP
ncbi:DUF932 domain-containing protein [Amycolatopsis sp. NPDC088138]|uniref:DUF932 domain-containing protein n=1 Tax=Amycolatopsis sp. NPDC088138 TaxID=3363938 RepID=UPI00380F0C36